MQVTKLLDLHADIDHALDKEKRTPMHYAATAGDVDVIRALWEGGGCVQVKN
jgi:ankyrin repeat protein